MFMKFSAIVSWLKGTLGLRCVAAAAILLVSLPVHAAPAKTARQYATEAETDYNLGHYAEAMVLFEKAYKIDPAPVFLLNIGQCHRRMGNNERALSFFRRYLDLAPANAAHREDAEKLVAELERSPPVAPAGNGTRAPAPVPAAPGVPVSTAQPVQPPTVLPPDAMPPPPPMPQPQASIGQVDHGTWKTPVGLALGIGGVALATWGIVWIAIDGTATGEPCATCKAIPVHNTKTAGWILAGAGAVAAIGGGLLFYFDRVHPDVAIGLTPSGLRLAGVF